MPNFTSKFFVLENHCPALAHKKIGKDISIPTILALGFALAMYLKTLPLPQPKSQKT